MCRFLKTCHEIAEFELCFFSIVESQAWLLTVIWCTISVSDTKTSQSFTIALIPSLVMTHLLAKHSSLRPCAVAWSNYLSCSEPQPPCVCRQFGVLLLATTASTSSPITRRRIGSHTGSRLCYVQGRLLQSAVGRSTKVCYRQVAAGHECCSASCKRHEVRPRLDTPASFWAALARCGRSSHIQAWGDGVQVLAWPGTGLSVWAVHTGRSSCWTTASSFRQPPSTRCSTVSVRYVRPSHLRGRWTNDMELVPRQFAWAGHANWLFSSYTEDDIVSFWSVHGTLSALEALFATSRLTLTFTFTLCDIVIFDLRPLHFSSSVRVTRDLSNPPVKVYVFLFLSQLQTWNERTHRLMWTMWRGPRIITHVAATDYDVLNKYHSRRLGSRLGSTNRSGIANTNRLCRCSWLNTNKT